MDNTSASITSILVGLVLVTLFVPSLGQEADQLQTEKDVQESLLSRMDNVQEKLAAVTSSAEQMQSEVEKAIFDCLGTHSELCSAQELESGLADQMGLQSFWSPGKRLSPAGSSPQSNSLYKELQRKRAVAQHLGEVLRGARNVIKEERKRSCNVNLGFPCDTSRLVEMAKVINFLNTPGSPGKKRSVRRR